MCVALCDLVTCVDLRKHYGTRGEELLTATKLPRLPLCCEPPLGPLTHPPRPQLSFRECRVRRCMQCVAFEGWRLPLSTVSELHPGFCVRQSVVTLGRGPTVGRSCGVAVHAPARGRVLRVAF